MANKTLIIDKRMRDVEKLKLKEMGYELIELKTIQDVYEEISSLAPNWLQPNGFLILEVGYGQSEQVINILQKSMFKIIDVKRDLSGIERTIIAQKESIFVLLQAL